LAILGCDAYFKSELRRSYKTDAVARSMSISSDLLLAFR